MVRRLALVLLFATSVFASSNDFAWREDLTYLKTELPKKHKNAFFRTTKAAFDAAAAKIDADIPTLSDHEIAVRMMQLVATIGDGHTTLTGYAFTRFPVRFYWFDDGIHVTRATEEHRDLLGARLVTIDGREVAELAEAVETVVPHENEMWLLSGIPDYLSYSDVLHALGMTANRWTARFVFEQANGTRIERDLSASLTPMTLVQAPVTVPLYRRDADLNYWYTYLPTHQTLYIRYNRCRDIPGRTTAQVGQEIAQVLNANIVARVIVDLRDNGGGNSQVLYPLLQPLELYPALNDAGKFFVIINRGTFSSAMLNAIQIDQQSNATLVGEPTGGKPNAYGEVLSVYLPRSNMRMQYSTKFFQLLPGQDPPSVAPERAIPFTSGDYFAARDPVLDALLPTPKRRRSVSGGF